MDMNVIRWKLNEVMAQKRIRNKDLAKGLGITETSVYRLRKTDEMPRLSPERLNGLCAAIKCQPGDLLEWVPDDGSNQLALTDSTSLESSAQAVDSVKTQYTSHCERAFSFIVFVSEVSESA